MKKNIIILISFFSFNCLHSQKLEVFSDVSFGFLTNQSLKDFHEELTNDIPFNNVKITDQFNSNSGFNIGIKFNQINTAIFYNYKVSGAKSSYSDFSGLIRLTNEVKGSTIGVVYEKSIKKLGKGDILLGAKGLLTFSSLELISNTRINNIKNDDIFNFSSTDFGAGLILTYKVPVAFFFLRAFIGFDAYIGGKLNFDNISNAHLLNNDGNIVTTDWTGINLGLGFSIPILK